MASYPPAVDQAQWRIAVRFLTFGIMVAGLIAVMWWLNRLADHLENQREVLLSIQRDVLVVQSQMVKLDAIATENAKRLGDFEGRQGRAAEDRQGMRETDRQLTDALIRLRADMDRVRDELGAPPGARGMADDPGPKTRRH